MNLGKAGGEMTRLANDPRPQFAYALICARRRWGRLFEEMPQDARQQVSLACCVEQRKTVELARAVDRAMYRLARNHGWHRPSAGLKRGKSGHWEGDRNANRHDEQGREVRNRS